MKRPKLKTLDEFWRRPVHLLYALADDVESINPNRYVWDMVHYHIPVREGRCSICMVGAMMAKRLDADPGREVWPQDFGNKTCFLLFAIDSFRDRKHHIALDLCGLKQAEIDRLIRSGGLPEADMGLLAHFGGPECVGKPDPMAIRDLASRLELGLAAIGFKP